METKAVSIRVDGEIGARVIATTTRMSPSLAVSHIIVKNTTYQSTGAEGKVFKGCLPQNAVNNADKQLLRGRIGCVLVDTENEELPTTITESDHRAVESRAARDRSKKKKSIRYPNAAKRDDVRAKLTRLLRREMQRRNRK